MADFKEWEGFEGRLWKEGIDVPRLHPKQLQTI